MSRAAGAVSRAAAVIRKGCAQGSPAVRSVPTRLTVNTHGRAVCTPASAKRGLVCGPADAGCILLALIEQRLPPMCRQQAMGARCVPATKPPSAGSRAWAQGGAAAGASTQRTLTKATAADAGRSDCTSSRVQSSQITECKRRSLISLSYHPGHGNVPYTKSPLPSLEGRGLFGCWRCDRRVTAQACAPSVPALPQGTARGSTRQTRRLCPPAGRHWAKARQGQF